jgi:hypothetical protein
VNIVLVEDIPKVCEDNNKRIVTYGREQMPAFAMGMKT